MRAGIGVLETKKGELVPGQRKRRQIPSLGLGPITFFGCFLYLHSCFSSLSRPYLIFLPPSPPGPPPRAARGGGGC
jgi:hypothetical protein